MKKIGGLFQTADWKLEKHVPVIRCDREVAADEMFDVQVSLGREVAHPNTTEHHIRWIQIYFHADGDKFPCQVGNFEFTAHGESTGGADKGPVYTNHSVTTSIKITRPGTLHATAMCNIHGLWENSTPVQIKQQ